MKTYTHLDVVSALEKKQNKQKALVYQRFFKTAKGEYGEGDQFFGVTVPQQRDIAKQYIELSLKELDMLLRHVVHECRLTALMIAVMQYKKGDDIKREIIYRWYLKNARQINNWDLVDSSASYIVGAYLFAQKKNEWKTVLLPLSKSNSLWERRIVIIATNYFIRQHSLESTIVIATQLLSDKHDLIHKACGWMLREVGKKDIQVLRVFLDTHAKVMPRTMLRYAIEKMSQQERKKYLARE